MAKINLGSLFFRLFADTKGVKDAEKDVKKSTKSMKKSFQVVGAAIAAAFAFNQARKIQILGEEMILLDIRLKEVSASTREFTRNQQQLLKIANKSGQSFKDVVVLFEKLKLASQDLNATNDQVLLLTDSLNKLGVIGGASATEINNSLRQLSQSFAGGIVRAEEFNSIVENTPAIARAIAKGLNVGVGEMRKMVIEGRLLSEDVFNAILSQQDNINERFERIPRTSSMAWQEVENNASQAIKLIVQELESSEGLSGALDRISDKIVPITRSFLRFAQKLQAAFQTFGAMTTRVFDILELTVNTFVTNTAQLLKVAFLNIPLTLEKAWAEALLEMEMSFNTLVTKLNDFASTDFELIDTDATLSRVAKLSQEMMTVLNDAGLSNHVNEMDRIETEHAARLAAIQAELGADIAAIDTKEQAEQAAGEDDIATIDAGTVSGSAEQDDAAFQDLMAKFGDESAIIEAAHRKRQEEINKIVGLGLKERAMLEKRSAMLRQRDLAQINMMRIASVKGAVDSVLQLIKDGNAEQSALGKVALGISKGLAVAEAAIALQQNIAQASKIGFPQNIPMIAGAVAQGVSIISTLSSISTSPGRVNGGSAVGGFATPITEDGAPEIFENARGKFLLPGKGEGGVVSPMDASSGSMGMNITIIDNAGVTVTPNSVSRDELEIILDKRQEETVDAINTSLATGQGDTFDSLRRSTQVNRNLR